MAAALAPMNCRHAVWSCEAEQAAATSATSHTLRSVTGREGEREREEEGGEEKEDYLIEPSIGVFCWAKMRFSRIPKTNNFTIQQNEVCLGMKITNIQPIRKPAAVRLASPRRLWVGG